MVVENSGCANLVSSLSELYHDQKIGLVHHVVFMVECCYLFLVETAPRSW
jgi:hypothetical protein